MSVKSIIMATLLLIITYMPAFTLVSILMSGSSGFALVVKNNPWMSIPIISSVTICIAMLLMAIIGKRRFAQYGFKLPKGSYVWKPIPVGFVVGIVINVLAELGRVELAWVGQIPLPYFILLSWIGVPIQEELIFRGLFQGYLAAHIKRSITISRWRLTIPALIGAIVFSLVHLALLSVEAALGGVLFIVVGAFILGIVAGYFRAETGSLIGPIIVHSLFNLTGTVFEL